MFREFLSACVLTGEYVIWLSQKIKKEYNEMGEINLGVSNLRAPFMCKWGMQKLQFVHLLMTKAIFV